jgi:hypothetical protein
MSNIKIKSTPGEFVLAGNQNIFKVVAPQVYNFGVYGPGWIYLQFSDWHVQGHYMTITNEYGSVTLYCKNNPDTSGLQYKAHTIGSLESWVEQTMGYLRKNPFLMQYYDLQYDVVYNKYKIYFKARNKGEESFPVLTGAPAGTIFYGTYGGFGSGDILPEGYKICLFSEKSVNDQYSGLTYKEIDGPFDCVPREPTREEIIADTSTYLRGAVLEKDISFLLKQKITGHYTFPEVSGIYKEHDILQLHSIFFYDQAGYPAVKAQGIWSDAFYSLAGKMSEMRQAQMHNDYGTFEDWLNSKNAFLTFAAVTKTIDANQPERLYWLCRVTETLTFIVEHTYEDGSTASFTESVAMTKGKVYEFFTNWYKMKMGATDRIIQYRVYLKNSGDIRQSEYRTYIMNTEYEPYARYFLFRNSFGVYECVRTTGKVSKNIEVKKESSLVELPANYKVRDVSEKVEKASGSNEYFVNSGYMDPDLADYFQEFLQSDDTLWLRMGKIYPVFVKDAKANVFKDGEFNNSIEFSLRHAMSDEFTSNFDNQAQPYYHEFNNDYNQDYD